MDKNKKTSQPAASVVALPAPALHTPAHRPSFTSLLAIDLAAETASLEAGRVSQTLANEALSLANLQPAALPKLLQRP
ncbi:MAG: hypothetical protein OJJ21_18395 [Ferrovibrio sp.]|uniref:hypothetical protein n=1 Tax=Ferrovibrio sp. TaxID=1917215 RepID=UPI0026223F9D|nr:hypothetical protein [Ferrovibrio sp.]MCW0235577.1 hypothetical protein [Ferrovibrio sp.]